VRSILDTCIPKREIITGSFNPEVFTASLGPVIDYYKRGRSDIDSVYTNAELFFKEATYPTQGLRLTLGEVFGRIAGDMTVPAIHRLETAFGGGKTHTLIACVHIAYRGKELQEVTRDIISPELLPEPGTVSVVGVAGDQIPVHKPKGNLLIPYTLWGEIAYQIGGEALYREVEEDATSYAAPGRNYFEKVLKDRRVIIMLDELAQYAARLEAARPDGANQLAAFLMALHGYARNHRGISVILTLASAADAFARQTEYLAELISNVRGQEVSLDDAVGIGEKAVKGVASVVARDAVQVTPVQAAEISSVLTKRLFESIDRDAAREVAGEYMALYRKNSPMLPGEAISENFKERMIANYPFHPTLIDFLNYKLADAETFQGTRGVLRVLALAVRSLWQRKQSVPMIHACHLDLRSERVVNEILGRTGSSDLLFVLNADIGSVDTGMLQTGKSNAQIEDERNPHPYGHPLYEYTWKTVFLNSLVGREEGLNSKIFGITEAEALLAVSFPGLTPSQVKMALDTIVESAFYLRYEQGKYFASSEPTINSVLARIRTALRYDQIKVLMESKVRTMIKEGVGPFHIEHNVTLPEHIPDKTNKPILAVVSLTAEEIDIEKMIYTKGINMPREQQNMVFLLVPETVRVKNQQQSMFDMENTRREEARQTIETIARQVKAMQLLANNPQNYGVNPARLNEDDFKKRESEREQSLSTAIARVYTRLYFPSASGHIVVKEIKTAGGEGGVPFIQTILDMLIEEKELLTEESNNTADLTNLSRLFFANGDTISSVRLKENFFNLRSWPVLVRIGVLEQIIRSGVQKGIWCVFCMEDDNSTKPAEFYDQNNHVPLGVNLMENKYMLVTPEGAKKRGWGVVQAVSPDSIRENVISAVSRNGTATVHEVMEAVKNEFSGVSEQDVQEVIVDLVKEGRFAAFHGEADQAEKPKLIQGTEAALYTPLSDDVLITRAKAAERGWLEQQPDSLRLSGREGAQKLLPILKRLGSLYNRGATSSIKILDLANIQLPKGGTIRLQLMDVPPESMKILGELFEIMGGVIDMNSDAEAYIEIEKPDKTCPLIKELTQD